MQFSFLADAPPEHRISIHVIANDTRAPVARAHVRLGFYAGDTDESGVARFAVPKGTHVLTASADGYTGLPISVEVDGDATVTLEAIRTLTEAEREERARQLEASSWG